MAGLLSLERRGDVAVVVLQRPDKRNALSIDLRLELADALSGLGSDGGVGCVVLTGADPAFSSGMDVGEFGGDRANRERLVESSMAAFAAVAECPKPVIAAVNGPALAGGFALALLCDLRLASERARFGYPELPRGIPPSYAAARAVLAPAVAAELCLTGRIVDSADALRLGIAGEVCAHDDLMPRALELAETVARMPRWAVLETKRRMLLDGRASWMPLLEDEERVFREVVLTGPSEPAA